MHALHSLLFFINLLYKFLFFALALAPSMVEYKSFFLFLKLFQNPILMFYFLSKNYLQIGIYATCFLLPALTAIYLLIKKRMYFKNYLFRTYTPSYKLYAFISLLDFVLCALFYAYTYTVIPARIGIAFYLVAAFHFLLFIASFLLVRFQNDRSRAIISYTRHKYKLGIVAHDIGGENGLKRGQPVEIVQDVAGGYIVKDNFNNAFELRTEDIESVLDIV